MTRAGIAIGALQFIFVIAVIALALFLSNALKPEAPQRQAAGAGAGETRTLEVSVIRPVPQDFVPRVRQNGTVGTRSRAGVTPEVSGRIIRVGRSFRTGGAFERGNLLFQIDPADFELAVERADAEIAAAESDLLVLEADAEIAIREWRDLYPGEEPTDLAARRPQIAAAEARLKSAIAARKTAELSLMRTTVRAPFDGRVISTQLEVGQVVGPNQSVGEIYPLAAVEVAVSLPSNDLALIQPAEGRDAKLTPPGGTPPIMGRVDRIDSVLDSRTRLATLRVAVDDGGSLAIGAFADVEIEGPAIPNTVAFPAAALTRQDAVWIVSDGRLTERTFKKIGERGGDVVARPFDIADGIVTRAPVGAAEGMPVSLSLANANLGTANGDRRQ